MKSWKNIIIIGLIATVGYVYWSNNEQKQQFKDNLSILNDTISTYKLKTGELVAEKAVLQVTGQDIKDQLYIKDSTLSELVQKYRKVQSTTTIQTVTKIDTLTIRSERVDSVNFKFSRFHKFYSISGSYNDERLLIDSLVLPNVQNIVTGIKKGRMSVSVTNSNPYIRTTGMNTQIVKVPVKRFGIGAFGGVDVTGSPTVGVGVTYSLIQF